jgi:hypothetical protein
MGGLAFLVVFFKHFHSYSAQTSAAKCGVSSTPILEEKPRQERLLCAPEVKML